MTKLDKAAAAWTVDGAPLGFADRVLAASADTSTAPPRWRVPVVALVAVAAAVLMFVAFRSGPEARGSLDATVRTSMEIPSAVAVADAGAQLDWRSIGDTVRVDQSSGRVFYRVERGAEFSVVTALGQVNVRGTSFEVEIENMRDAKRTLSAAATGIAVAAAVTVVLYEGRVVVASDHGAEALAPGQTARLRPGQAPSVVERDDVLALRSENDRLRRALDAKRRLPSQAAEEPPAAASEESKIDTAAEIHSCAMKINGTPPCSMLHPPQSVLEHRADCGVVVYDRPRALTESKIDFSELAEVAGLDPGERTKLDEAAASFYEDTRARMQGVYTELGGDPSLSAKLSTEALASEIDALIASDADLRDHYDAAAARYSAVLVAREPAPDLTDLTPAERHAYIWTASGDMFESWLADRLGQDRARELREVNDGWVGNRGMQGTPRCPD